MNNETLGTKIRTLRTRFQLTQKQLADMMNVSDRAISKWENDEGIPDVDNLIRLSNIFNVNLDDLLKNQDEIISTKGKKQERTFDYNEKMIMALFLGILIATFVPLVKLNLDQLFSSLMDMPFDSGLFNNAVMVNLNTWQTIRSFISSGSILSIIIAVLFIGYLFSNGYLMYRVYTKTTGNSTIQELALYFLIGIITMTVILLVIIFLTPGAKIGLASLLYIIIQTFLFILIKKVE